MTFEQSTVTCLHTYVEHNNYYACFFYSDIRNCVIGNIRLMDKVRADMANFKAYIESTELPKFESRMKGITEKVSACLVPVSLGF